jgi:hypothetical protein
MPSFKKSICIFLVSGHTYTFRDVKITCDNETVIAFEYKAMSDAEWKHAVFFKQHVAGISTLSEKK